LTFKLEWNAQTSAVSGLPHVNFEVCDLIACRAALNPSGSQRCWNWELMKFLKLAMMSCSRLELHRRQMQIARQCVAVPGFL
jgi:hypothetical protein